MHSLKTGTYGQVVIIQNNLLLKKNFESCILFMYMYVRNKGVAKVHDFDDSEKKNPLQQLVICERRARCLFPFRMQKSKTAASRAQKGSFAVLGARRRCWCSRARDRSARPRWTLAVWPLAPAGTGDQPPRLPTLMDMDMDGRSSSSSNGDVEDGDEERRTLHLSRATKQYYSGAGAPQHGIGIGTRVTTYRDSQMLLKHGGPATPIILTLQSCIARCSDTTSTYDYGASRLFGSAPWQPRSYVKG